MDNNSSPLFQDPGILAYIEQLQGIIARMASNSANCKVCAVSIVAAILALGGTAALNKFLICLGPIILMLLTDAYYLGFERRFRNISNTFISEIKRGNTPELFNIPKSNCKEQFCDLVKALKSLSTTPFYILLALAPLIFLLFNA